MKICKMCDKSTYCRSMFRGMNLKKKCNEFKATRKAAAVMRSHGINEIHAIDTSDDGLDFLMTAAVISSISDDIDSSNSFESGGWDSGSSD